MMKFILYLNFLLAVSCSFLAVPSPAEREIASEKNCNELVENFFSHNSPQLISQKKLEKYDYKIENNVLSKMIKGKSVTIGTISTIHPRYFFEWQDKEMQDIWIKGGGIYKKYMDEILADQGQVHGKGFYVSLNPADSIAYGPELTIFEVSEPVTLIAEFNTAYENDEKLLKELREIGFGGMLINNTWLNIFNERYLQNPKKINWQIFNDLVKPEANVPLYPNDIKHLIEKPSISSQLIKNSQLDVIYKKVFNDEILTDDERLFFTKSIFFRFSYFLKKIQSDDGFVYLKKIFSYMNKKDFIYFIALIEGDLKKSEMPLLQSIESAFHKTGDIDAFFELFDLFDIATLKNKGIGEKLSYQKMLLAAKNYQGNMKQVDLKTIQGPQEFKEMAEKTLGLDYKFRDFEAIMGGYGENEFTIEIEKNKLSMLKDNSFLDVKIKSNFTDKFLTLPWRAEVTQSAARAQVSYFSLASLKGQAKTLFTSSELKTIRELQNTSEKKALRKANEYLYNKFFDPSSFNKIIELITPKDEDIQATPELLYRAFVSLHSFEDGNGRISRLYYKWLVMNYFPQSNTNPFILINDLDLFSYFQNERYRSIWYFSRIWVLSAKDENEMIQRSKDLLSEESNHKDLIESAKYLRKFISP
jgi:hypothetical protein